MVVTIGWELSNKARRNRVCCSISHPEGFHILQTSKEVSGWAGKWRRKLCPPPQSNEGFCKFLPNPVCLKPQLACWGSKNLGVWRKASVGEDSGLYLALPPFVSHSTAVGILSWQSELYCAHLLLLFTCPHKEEMLWVRTIVTDIASEIIICLGVRGLRIPLSSEMSQWLETTIMNISLTYV